MLGLCVEAEYITVFAHSASVKNLLLVHSSLRAGSSGFKTVMCNIQMLLKKETQMQRYLNVHYVGFNPQPLPF